MVDPFSFVVRAPFGKGNVISFVSSNNFLLPLMKYFLYLRKGFPFVTQAVHNDEKFWNSSGNHYSYFINQQKKIKLSYSQLLPITLGSSEGNWHKFLRLFKKLNDGKNFITEFFPSFIFTLSLDFLLDKNEMTSTPTDTSVG